MQKWLKQKSRTRNVELGWKISEQLYKLCLIFDLCTSTITTFNTATDADRQGGLCTGQCQAAAEDPHEITNYTYCTC